jgi:hypothetical protein
MWRRTILLVNGDQREAVLNAVQSYFESDRRFRNMEWLESGRVLTAYGRHNLSTGGEGVKIEVNGRDGLAMMQVDILSVSVPIYDWGKNQRNIDSLVNYLRMAGFVFEVKASEGKHKIGGPS